MLAASPFCSNVAPHHITAIWITIFYFHDLFIRDNSSAVWCTSPFSSFWTPHVFPARLVVGIESNHTADQELDSRALTLLIKTQQLAWQLRQFCNKIL
jgi:hypothetical protein